MATQPAAQDCPAPAPGRLLRRKEVEHEVGLGRSWIYHLIARNEFPRPRRVGKRAVRWAAADIEQWKASQPQVTPSSAT